MSTKRKAEASTGPVEERPEVGDGKLYKLVKSESVLIGKQKHTTVTLERMEDDHQFTMYCGNSRQVGRRPGKLVHQLDVIVSGEFTIANESDGQLGQGSNKKIELVRTRDGQRFTMICRNFCVCGHRPPEKLVHQLDVIASGEFTIVNESDGKLGQGSNKKIELVRTRDGHHFTMNCSNFCGHGHRPPEKLVYQSDNIRSGEFTLVNDEDGRLGQGSGKKIELVRTRDGHSFTMSCSNFCGRGRRPPDKLLY